MGKANTRAGRASVSKFGQSASAINNEGQIVGYGIYNGQPGAFLLTPNPVPLSHRSPTLRHRPRRVGSAWLAQEAEGCLTREISFYLADCTAVRAFDTFPLTCLWRIHHQRRLNSLSQWTRCRSSRYLVTVAAAVARRPDVDLRLAAAAASQKAEEAQEEVRRPPVDIYIERLRDLLSRLWP